MTIQITISRRRISSAFRIFSVGINVKTEEKWSTYKLKQDVTHIDEGKHLITRFHGRAFTNDEYFATYLFSLTSRKFYHKRFVCLKIV